MTLSPNIRSRRRHRLIHFPTKMEKKLIIYLRKKTKKKEKPPNLISHHTAINPHTCGRAGERKKSRKSMPCPGRITRTGQAARYRFAILKIIVQQRWRRRRRRPNATICARTETIQASATLTSICYRLVKYVFMKNTFREQIKINDSKSVEL